MTATITVTFEIEKLHQSDIIAAQNYITDLCRLVEHALRNYRQKHYQGLTLCPKDSPPCPPNEEKKSPDEVPNASTNSTGNTNTIPLQVPKQHRNATLSVQINPLTREPELYYAYQDANDVLHSAVFKPQAKPKTIPLKKQAPPPQEKEYWEAVHRTTEAVKADQQRLIQHIKVAQERNRIDTLSAPYDHEGAPAKFFTGDNY